MLVDKAFSHAAITSLGVIVGVGPHFRSHEGPVDQILTLVDRPELSEVEFGVAVGGQHGQARVDEPLSVGDEVDEAGGVAAELGQYAQVMADIIGLRGAK
jgi:hypothetical protein